MRLSRERLQREATATGFRVEILEPRVRRVPHHGVNRGMRGSTASSSSRG